MKDSVFALLLSSMVCVTSPAFAMLPLAEDVPCATPAHQMRGGLYLAEPTTIEGSKPYFHYQETEESDEIRRAVDTTSSSQLRSTHPEHFAFHETSELSTHECHKYALAKLFGYETMPQWIFHTLIPSLFKYDEYLRPTSTPKKGDLVIYFNNPALVGAKHFGIFDGVRVISTWGTSMNNAYRHAPFFTPEMYGKYIAFYTSPEETDFKSIRKVIERQNRDKVYAEILGGLEEGDKLSVTTASAPFVTDDMEPSDVWMILHTFKGIEREERESIKDLTLFLIDGKVSMIESMEAIFKELSQINPPEKREQVVTDAKIIPINRMTGYDFARSSSIVSYYMNGHEIAAILKAANKLPEEGRPEILQDANLIVTKLKDRDISDVITVVAGLDLPNAHRTDLITSTMALIQGKVLWSDVKSILYAMKRLSPVEWENVAASLKGSYCGDTNGSYFVFQHRKLLVS